MKTNHRWLISTIVILSASSFFIACNKDNSTSSHTPAGKSKLSIYMMDDPLAFTQVLINIKQVADKVDIAAHREDADDNHHQQY